VSQEGFFKSMAELADRLRREKLEAAEAEAAERLAQADREIAARRAAALDKAQKKAEAVAHRERARVREEAVNVRFAAREAIIEDVLKAVHAELAALARSSDFTTALTVLLKEALEQGEGKLVAQVPQAHVALCREWVAQSGYGDTMIEGDSNLVDGVVVADRDHTFRVSNTLAGRLERRMDDIRKLCAERLFS